MLVISPVLTFFPISVFGVHAPVSNSFFLTGSSSAIGIGRLVILFRKLTEEKSSSNKEVEKVPTNLLKNLWQSWKNFSKRMGSFQSRIMLSLFFFIFVSPFALAVKIFSDPLKIKHKSSKSHWLPKKEIKYDLEQYRRQF